MKTKNDINKNIVIRNHPNIKLRIKRALKKTKRNIIASIDLSPRSTSAITRRRHLERKLLELMYKEWSYIDFIYWCKFSLELFHSLQLPIKTVNKLICSSDETDKGFALTYCGDIYFIPKIYVD